MILDQVWHQTPYDEPPGSPDEVEAFEEKALAAAAVYRRPAALPDRVLLAHLERQVCSRLLLVPLSEVMDADTSRGSGRTAARQGEQRPLPPYVARRGASIDVVESCRLFRCGPGRTPRAGASRVV